MSPLRRHPLTKEQQSATAAPNVGVGNFAIARPGEESRRSALLEDGQATVVSDSALEDSPEGSVALESDSNSPRPRAASNAPAANSPDPNPPKVPSTKTSSIWMTAAFAVLLLAAVVVFVTQNPTPVVVHFFGAQGHLSLAVALLASCVVGAALVLLIGAARILQLRRLSHRRGRAVKGQQGS